jgi:hypothetical protein
MSTRGAMSRDAVRGLAGGWWLFLILGVLWILFGMFVLSYNVGSLLALAVFCGVTFSARSSPPSTCGASTTRWTAPPSEGSRQAQSKCSCRARRTASQRRLASSLR